MRKVAVIFLAALALLTVAACRPRTPLLQAPPTPELLPTPTLAPTATPVGAVLDPSAGALDPAATPDPAAPPAVIGEGLPGAVVTGFDGTFSGTLMSDSGSSAPATLTLTTSGNTVTGAIEVGQGLVVDGGNCGQTAVPAGAVSANGQIDPATPNQLTASSLFNVQGLAIELSLVGALSADGQTLTAEAVIDLPLLCGRDPAISGSFVRQ